MYKIYNNMPLIHLLLFSFLTFGCEAKALDRRNTVYEKYDRSREGRGLEDTDTGICQTNGMEATNLNLSNFYYQILSILI